MSALMIVRQIESVYVEKSSVGSIILSNRQIQPSEVETMKRIHALFGLALPLFLFGSLHANDLQEGTTHQTQPEEKMNDLSWPKAELLDSSLHWQSHADIAHKCLLVHRLDPKDPTITRLLDEVDLPGERIEATNIPIGSPHYFDWIATASKTLVKAGYVQDIAIPDSQIILETQKEASQSHGEIVNTVKGYIRRSKESFRLVMITQTVSTDMVTKPPIGYDGFRRWIPVKLEIFVTNTVPLEKILREKKQ